jgi:hypothetical protein
MDCWVQIDQEVLLIYWPPSLTSRDICANDGRGKAVTLSQEYSTPPVVTVSAITFSGPDISMEDEFNVNDSSEFFLPWETHPY